MSIYVPKWVSKLPVILARPRVAIDNNVISDFYIRKATKPDLPFMFETSNIVLCCSRQVINEALNPPGLPPQVRSHVWESLSNLQDKGKLFLSGFTQMDNSMRETFQELSTLLGESNLSPGKDANVFADAIVKHLPLYTTEVRSVDGMARALRNTQVADFLEERQLPNTLETIVANSD
jgi:hypothetical protein